MNKFDTEIEKLAVVKGTDYVDTLVLLIHGFAITRQHPGLEEDIGKLVAMAMKIGKIAERFDMVDMMVDAKRIFVLGQETLKKGPHV